MYNFVQSSETVLESQIHFTKYTLQNTLYKIYFIWLILARCWGDPKPQSIPATHWYDIIIIIIVIFVIIVIIFNIDIAIFVILVMIIATTINFILIGRKTVFC